MEDREQIRLGIDKEKPAGQLVTMQKRQETSLEEHVSEGGHSRRGLQEKR